jgi:hypothetical protein
MEEGSITNMMDICRVHGLLRSGMSRHTDCLSSNKQESDLPVECEEIRQIYKKKAPFTDSELSLIVNRITADKKIWLDTMLKEEIGLTREHLVSPPEVGHSYDDS